MLIVAPSLVNSFLRRALLRMDRQFTNMLFDVTIDYFRHPSLSEEMVLALMHTLKSYLTAVRTCSIDPSFLVNYLGAQSTSFVDEKGS